MKALFEVDSFRWVRFEEAHAKTFEFIRMTSARCVYVSASFKTLAKCVSVDFNRRLFFDGMNLKASVLTLFCNNLFIKSPITFFPILGIEKKAVSFPFSNVTDTVCSVSSFLRSKGEWKSRNEWVRKSERKKNPHLYTSKSDVNCVYQHESISDAVSRWRRANNRLVIHKQKGRRTEKKFEEIHIVIASVERHKSK